MNGDTSASLTTPPTCSTTATSHSPAGSYPSSCSGAVDSNYTITYVNGTVTDSAAALAITANNASRAYGAANPNFAATYSGFVNGDTASSLTGTLTCTTAATASSPAGPYPITCSGQTLTNYAITYSPGTLTVTAVPLTITANNTTRGRGTANSTLTATYSGFVNGDTASSLTGTLACTTTATAGSPAGPYPITCSGQSSTNYNITYSAGTLTVTAPPPLTIAASSASMTYGGTPPTVTPSYSGFVNGDTAASLSTPPTCSTTATSHSPAGSYPTICSGAVDSNYAISYVGGTVTDSAAALAITASSASMTYGGTVPLITPSYSGLVNGDTAASLSTPPTCSTTATSRSATGSYPSSCSGAVDGNYAITYVPGNVTVSKPSLTVTASSGSMTYGGTPPTVTPTYSGFVNGDTVASLTTAPTCTTTASSSTPVGTDTGADTCSGAVDGNYTITYVPGNVTVSKPSLTITASSGSMTYGGTPPSVTPSYSGFVNGDTPASLTTGPTCTTTATSSTPVGTDTGADTCSGAVDPNYSFTYVAGSVMVNQATPVITWTPAPITYGATLGSTQLNAIASVPGTFVYSPAAGTTPATGADTLSATFTPIDTTDYTTATQTVSLTVSKATPVITWATPAAITYGTTLSSTQLNATASVIGTFVYSPAAGTTPAAGTDTLSVTFTPTDAADYNPATATVTLAVADFTFTASSGSSTSASVAPGQSATYTLSVGGEGGLSGTVTFTCAVAPVVASGPTCVISPNSATAGSSATNVTVAVTTTAASGSAPRSRRLPPVPPLSPGLKSLLMLALALAAMAWVIRRRKQPGVSRWRSTMVLLASGLLLTLALAGCGGGNVSGGSGGAAPSQGTPAETYTLTVTGTTGSGAATLSHSVSLTLKVS
ncbi:MAG TPA: MBG domain-containing protein [Terriglobia bacterium]|nr:MBG domain-containing protein [Terriglobia bacterium]